MDPAQLNQILVNLVANSRDALPQGGQITIATAMAGWGEAECQRYAGAAPGTYVLLLVRDTGAGIPPAVRAHLFDPFFTTKELGRGTGLGLATVYGIVTQNGGTIHVESAPGQGTIVTIALPPVAAEATAPSPHEERALPRGRETVLVAEDEQALLYMVREILVGQGYTVLAAQSPHEALALAARHPGPIDLLLTDAVMPQMNGRALWQHLQAERPGLRALFISGYPDEVLAHHGVLEAGVHFLAKPFAPHALAAKVRAVLKGGVRRKGRRQAGPDHAAKRRFISA
jgi:CheY-like chemotaxis protein